jgi:hypothetical protein
MIYATIIQNHGGHPYYISLSFLTASYFFYSVIVNNFFFPIEQKNFFLGGHICFLPQLDLYRLCVFKRKVWNAVLCKSYLNLILLKVFSCQIVNSDWKNKFNSIITILQEQKWLLEDYLRKLLHYCWASYTTQLQYGSVQQFRAII